VTILGLDLVPSWRREWLALRRPIGSLAEEIEEYERRDQARTRLMAWTMAAWCAALSSFRPLEAAVFGVASFIAVYRLPATLRVVRAAMRSPVALLVLGYLVVVAVATLRSPVPAGAWTVLPSRMFAVPLLMLPVLGRWRLLLAGLALGSLAHAAVAVGAAVFASRSPLADNGPATLVVLAGVGTALLCANGGGRRAIGAATLALAFTAQAHATVRAGFVGILAAIATVAGLASWRARLVAAGVVALAGAGVVLLAPRGDSPASSIVPARVAFDYESLNEYSSNRLEMWRLTLVASADAPLFGHGRNAWRTTIDAMRPEEGATLRGAELIWTHREVGYAHNTPVDAIFEAGFVGAAMLFAAAALLLRRARRASRTSVAARVAFAVFVGALALACFDNVFERSIPGALLVGAACLALGPEVERQRAAFRGRDAWVERLLRG
jgi:O-antigen ligase